ncbi:MULTISPECIES: 2-succinyl-5-enolpyruvyl-6-hydroxy-3-cyclohexene-1-carboxylic-acid synthase [unclassified Microcoleus]|uniref:2-succinyl-5-enolpyruvyl-6-hydroxy-3- cyclohexene-1-carboxylic-acid synthase n=1 Tax=unclassified Microcoleus TaxID=2642155 RepID=UPI001D1EF200|nr:MULTISPECIES: 2-succinyl-5-enolpyruvyl-6-hydroxy-3-cyclohexene-1-carboxylic-acid synthase [unclassified Microcoleus]TAE11204.1 MAG: 2-succinyl-5-enolpyruvyl-6-hydroxy-3-cyclohexene-1-carboxylic-acid synthase [Oscillatoriales cyanobacterium]MCC3412463.1 2-succinyl-5-enolpyruvyl-6-hydroxy-3-cyclohexene-1-carboxylic-acid synthase [Microcoleus sp. PH2017_02_FOX_O_A]MCC3450857.1 2-succinyl-5-enolpyruvyl-6-hydroxy-3-cyclohexene-1-carboxylic-acid synthase [Microcoleus sp. PH2017_09_SFU_O_A]MCC34917
MLDFRNTNTLWASIIAETLQRLGLTTAVICPGSRSAPLTIAFAQNKLIETIPILDERSASFFALGIAKKSGVPTALICTSGTAAANFYPAIIEARESRIPLLILTADRPPELRDCHAGQAIDQVKLYGNYPNWQAELAIPSASIGMLDYVRQTIVYAIERSTFPTPGPVHLNIPLRDPLVPVSDIAVEALETQFDIEYFFAGLEPIFAAETSTPPSPPLLKGGVRSAIEPICAAETSTPPSPPLPRGGVRSAIEQWPECSKGIIIAGVAQPEDAEKYCSAIGKISQLLNWPVLAEGLSPLRNRAQLNPHLISTYDLILRNRELADKLTPEIAIQIGDLPTSKELRNWLDKTQPKRYIIDPGHHNLDPLHGPTIHLRTSIENLATAISLHVPPLSKGGLGGVLTSPTNSPQIPPLSKGGLGGVLTSPTNSPQIPPLNKGGLGGVLTSPSNEYLQLWRNTETQVRQTIDQKLSAINHIIEPKISWLLSQILPPATPIFISNSMPVRDVEFFWKPNNLEIKPFVNRGANGIDGTLSTALGVAHRNQSSILLTGDLTLLHDTNGFLITNKFVGHLTIVLINNNGGGIFEMLPVAKFDPPFEEFFATPQDINFAQLCATYGVEHEIIEHWEQFQQKLSFLPNNGIRVLELQTNRRSDAKWRQDNLSKFAKGS